MFIKRILLIVAVCLMSGPMMYAQQDDFCDAVTTITRDAPNKFKNIKGKLIESNVNASYWACGINIPGVIKSRFVSSMGFFYEGAFFQTRNKEEVQAIYNKYKDQLNACLSEQGYKLSLQDNFYPGMSSYKKLVFMQDLKEEAMPENAPPHLTMEATYSKELGLYTVVMYIFQH